MIHDINSNGILHIPEGIKTIHEREFEGIDELRSVIFPEGLLDIEDMAFSRCRNLKEVRFPRSLERIGDAAFMSDPKLEKAVFSPELKEIGSSAFVECPSLTYVYVPGRETSVSSDSFGSAFAEDDLSTLDFFGLDIKTYIKDGYFAFPFFDFGSDNEKWLYASLLCAEIEGHSQSDITKSVGIIRKIGKDFVKRAIDLNAPKQIAGLIRLGLIDRKHLDEYLEISAGYGYTEINSLLLGIQGSRPSLEEELFT